MSDPNWKPTAAGAHLRGRKTADTSPEIRLRRALHALGLRYRLNRSIGRFRPDLVFQGRRAVVFVDGCFWHSCPTHGMKEFRGPNAAQWREKLEANQRRDARASIELQADGWTVIRVWECEIRHDVQNVARLVAAAIHTTPGVTSGTGLS